MKLLASKLGVIVSNEGQSLQVDNSLPTVSSVLFDAIFIPGDESTATTDKFPRAVLDRSFNFGFRAVLLNKDVRLCKEFADENGVSFTIGSAVAKVWEEAAAELGDQDFTRIVELIERRAGVVVRGTAKPSEAQSQKG